MNILRAKSIRYPATVVVAVGAAAGMAGLIDWMAAGTSAILLSAAAGLVAAVVCLFAAPRDEQKAAQAIATMSEEIDHIMIGAAETAYFVDSIKKKVDVDLQTTEEITGRAQHTAHATEQIAANAERAAKVAADVRAESVAGRAEIDQGLQRISNASQDAQSASELMSKLQEKARRIHGITEVINEIAARTNLLALNAAIEAARAGEHGRGFAVVAGEVRQLAQRTKSATDDIGLMVREINEEAERAAAGMQALTGKVRDAAQNVERVHSFLGSIERSSSVSESEIQQIASSAREHVDTTHVIADAIERIRDGMLATEEDLPRAANSAMVLSERGETLFDVLSHSEVSTSHDEVRDIALQAARDIGKLFEQAVASGQIAEAALFDRRYKAVPNTNPQKHTTAYDAFTDRVLPAIQEPILERSSRIAFAAAVDSHGYLPTHNRKFSQPMTGNYEKDLVNSRTKRIFSDRTGSRCGSNTKPFLLQTYKRDTGEIMHDLSVPIYVNGKHWGGFRVGYRSNAPTASTAGTVKQLAPGQEPRRKLAA